MAASLVAIVNESRLAPDVVLRAARAVQRQLLDHLFPVWGVSGIVQVVDRGAMPAGAWPVYVRDRIAPGIVGQHRAGTPPWAEVGVLDAEEDDRVPWSAVLSHEVGELLLNPDCNLCIEAGAEVWMFEPFDPVYGQRYFIDGVAVSNFVLRSFYQPGAPGPWDFCRRLDGPLRLVELGYKQAAPLGTWSAGLAAD